MWSILNNASNSSLVNSCPVAFFSSMLSELPGPESCDSSSESLTCDFSSFPTASIQMFSEGGETSLTVEDKMSHFVLVSLDCSFSLIHVSLPVSCSQESEPCAPSLYPVDRFPVHFDCKSTELFVVSSCMLWSSSDPCSSSCKSKSFSSFSTDISESLDHSDVFWISLSASSSLSSSSFSFSLRILSPSAALNWEYKSILIKGYFFLGNRIFHTFFTFWQWL